MVGLPRLAILTDTDEKVRAMSAILIALARQHGGVLRVNRRLIESCHVGHVIEQIDDEPDCIVFRVTELPAEQVQMLADAMRAIAGDVGDTEHNDPEHEAFVAVPHDIIG
jgi:hypothetical protein